MKRALSLIIVLAMVLCMIPFSAFAAEWSTDGTDFVDGGNYALLEENNWLIEELLWIPEESGTLKGINFTPFVEEVAEGEVGEDYSEIPVLFDVYGWEEFPEEGIEVTAGVGYEISLYTNDQDWKGTATINFVGEAGSQSNPYVIHNPEAAEEMGVDTIDTVTVLAGETVYCSLVWFGGETVRVEGEGVEVAMGEEVIGENGVAELAIPASSPSIEIQLTNTTEHEQIYTFTMVEEEVVVGTMDAPEEVVADTYTHTFAAGAEPYYYQYIAEGDGTVKVTVNAADAEGNEIGWTYQILNNTTYAQNDIRWFNDDPVVNPDSMNVSEGDEIVVWVNTYAPNDSQGNMQQNPAGTVTTTIEFVAEGSEEPAPTDLVLGDNTLTVANGATNEYTFTPDKDGTLTVAVTNLDPAAGNFGMIFGMGNMTLLVNGENYFSPSVECEVTAGTPVTVSLVNNMGQDETVTLNLAMAEPAAEIVLPWNETIEGEHNVYYTYTATEDCIIEFTSTGYLSIDGAEVKTYDESTKYVVLSAGDVISINPWAYETASYTAAIVEELPAANGSNEFPYVIDTVPYDASNSGETTLYYVYTATEDVVLNIIGDCYVDNGGWDDARDEDNNVVLYTGNEILISIYGGQAFVLDAVDPVATIGDAKYYSIDAAVAAAGNGDEIVLCADAESVTGITLFAGVTLNLNGNNLSAPYVAALNGNFVVGAAGATINTTNMVAPELINIDGVDYEWVAGDGVYTLTAVGAEPVADPVAKIGTTPYATVEDALNAAKSGDTVTMIADDLDNADATLIIKVGVTLDIKAFDLAALNIIGLNGGFIKASTVHATNDYGTITVDNMMLGETAPAGSSSGYSLIPFLYGDKYVFGQVMLSQTAFKSQDEGNTYYVEFGFNMTGAAKTLMINDGSSDNAVNVVVKGTWKTDSAELSQSFIYNDEFVGTASKDKKTLKATIGDVLNKSEIKMYAQFVTNSGIIVSIPFENITVG